jgi:hypothetical protein
MLKPLSWAQSPALAPERSARQLTAALLRTLSVRLARLARSLVLTERRRLRAAPVLEFYAEAGAPEGALYLDGKLVGYVAGVRRL